MAASSASQASNTSLNRSAEHRLGSLEATVHQLAEAVPGAPILINQQGAG